VDATQGCCNANTRAHTHTNTYSGHSGGRTTLSSLATAPRPQNERKVHQKDIPEQIRAASIVGSIERGDVFLLRRLSLCSPPPSGGSKGTRRGQAEGEAEGVDRGQGAPPTGAHGRPLGRRLSWIDGTIISVRRETNVELGFNRYWFASWDFFGPRLLTLVPHPSTLWKLFHSLDEIKDAREDVTIFRLCKRTKKNEWNWKRGLWSIDK